MPHTAYEAIQLALDTCPYPATQIPVTGDEPTYVSWQMVVAVPKRASNGTLRAITTFQVDIWSRLPIGPELYPVLKALTHAGIVVQRWGPALYEQDTRWHHMPITCQFGEFYELSVDANPAATPGDASQTVVTGNDEN